MTDLGGGGGGGELSWTVTIMYVLIYDWLRRGGVTIMNSNYHACSDLWLIEGGGVEGGGALSWTVTTMHLLIMKLLLCVKVLTVHWAALASTSTRADLHFWSWSEISCFTPHPSLLWGFQTNKQRLVLWHTVCCSFVFKQLTTTYLWTSAAKPPWALTPPPQYPQSLW